MGQGFYKLDDFLVLFYEPNSVEGPEYSLSSSEPPEHPVDGWRYLESFEQAKFIFDLEDRAVVVLETFQFDTQSPPPEEPCEDCI